MKTNEYPKEDKCRVCGVHLGWMLDPIGGVVAPGICEKPQCQKIDKARRGTNGNSDHACDKKKTETGV